VGNKGATLGIVGTDWGAAEVVAVAGVDDEDDETAVVGKTIFGLEVTTACGCGSGCRLCGRQFLNEDLQPKLGDADKMSKAAGCTMYRVVAVIRTRTSGTRRTANLIRRDMARFASTEAEG
jgi:hypothetical protein